MIPVTCESCGASFKAREEHAGKRGKCPACGEVLQIPAASSGPAPADDSPPRGTSEAVAAVGTGSRVRRAGASRAGRRRSRSSGGKDYKALTLILIFVGALTAGIAYMVTRDGDGPNHLGRGVDYMSSGEYAAAIAAFEQVPQTDRGYPQAQEYLQECKEYIVADQQRRQTRDSENLYQVIKFTEKNWVDRKGKGHLEPTYASNTRYMLKRSQEFLERFPDDPRVTEIRQLMFRYSDVASLDDPLTYADVEAELNFRLMLNKPNFKAATEVIDEFAAANADQQEQSAELRRQVVDASLAYWKQIKAKLESQGALTAGDENWQMVANQCLRYLNDVKSAPGLTPVAEAQALYDRALAGG